MPTKNAIEIVLAVLISVPVYAWFFKLWFGNFSKVWKNNRFAAVLPVVIPLWSIFTLWIQFTWN